MVIEAKPKYFKLVLDAIDSSIKQDRVIALKWHDKLAAILDEVCDDKLLADNSIEFRAASSDLRPHWCVRLDHD